MDTERLVSARCYGECYGYRVSDRFDHSELVIRISSRSPTLPANGYFAGHRCSPMVSAGACELGRWYLIRSAARLSRSSVLGNRGGTGLPVAPTPRITNVGTLIADSGSRDGSASAIASCLQACNVAGSFDIAPNELAARRFIEGAPVTVEETGVADHTYSTTDPGPTNPLRRSPRTARAPPSEMGADGPLASPQSC